jgi:hypothetical protein
VSRHRRYTIPVHPALHTHQRSLDLPVEDVLSLSNGGFPASQAVKPWTKRGIRTPCRTSEPLRSIPARSWTVFGSVGFLPQPG